MTMLLRDKDKQSLSEIFSSLDVPIEVWAYGSRVNGSAHEGSDLDLVVRTNDLTPLPLDILVDLVEKIRESNIPILVELHDWTRLPSSFHRNIERQYEVLFTRASETIVPEKSAEEIIIDLKASRNARKKDLQF